jgi:chaperonin GroEL
METIKTKSAAKVVIPKSKYLQNIVLETMDLISKTVGATLGPGGHPVLIERQEYGLPPLVTKDGVTVFRSLGFENSTQQVILEAARDATVRTAAEAGDGTTTATIISEAFVRYTTQFCNENPTVPPIKVVKTIQKVFQENIVPIIKKLTINCDFTTKKGKDYLRSVAKISANGDEVLADAVMQCFEITGDSGNVTIVESSGPSGVEVEKIEGYPIYSGYEESCAKFYPAFINDPATQRVILEKPGFILYFGRLNDMATCLDLFDRINDAHNGNYSDVSNFVLFATGFSESVLANLASIFVNPRNIKVLPVVIPKTAVLNSERHFLDDVAAVTGAEIFDPLTKQLNEAQFEDLGNVAKEDQICSGTPREVWVPLGVKLFECTRYRSTIIGHCDEEILLNQVKILEDSIPNAVSEYDSLQLKERLAKITNGIAKLHVKGSSNGELKERRDRAEDAVCAVRGAIKHGALIGGGWTMTNLAYQLENTRFDKITENIVLQIINPSLFSTCEVLFRNAGFDAKKQNKKVRDSIITGDPQSAVVTDMSTGEEVKALKAGILDSTPAVVEAIKNAISISTLLGTLGGCVVFPRDREFEIKDARDASEFQRMSNFNMADERV